MGVADEKQADDHVLSRVPTSKPPFTLAEIRKAIPSHCFERSVLKSSAHLLVDLTVIFLLFSATKYFDKLGVFEPVAWVLYWAAQGCFATGVWVIAHECGHQAFSPYGWVNDLVGLFFHSWLLVPYFSWKFSHRRHHANNGSIDRDEVFVPKLRSEVGWLTTVMQHTPGRVLSIAFMLTLGWPLYLMFNVSGRSYERSASHFDPDSPIFSKKEKMQVIISDVALAAVALCLWYLGSSYGYILLFKVYGVPLLIVNAFLVLITFLQHTHPSIPHYEDAEWEWLRGELVTVDRDYGILNHVFHHIGDTHVAHHFFSTMPHYHAQEATEAIKPVLGKYYKFDSTPIPIALWRDFKECIYVEPDTSGEGVVWFKSKLA